MKDPNNQIRVTVVKTPIEPASNPGIEKAELSSPPSISIYIAGLMVSLSGMYAATYDMADTNFAVILRSLVICGYCVSYWLRRNRIDLKQYQAPLLVVFATVMYFVASTAPELSSATSSSGLSRPYQIQVVVIWIAVLQSFTLCADSAILFACVPSMALIGIMSSGTPDNEVQYAFFVFLASATFLMVHENHLRTRSAMAQRSRSALRLDNRLFRGEILLVGCCVAGTMLLATFVATPIEIIGKALIPANPQDGSKTSSSKQASASANVHVDESSSMDLGTGPRTEGDVDLLSFSTISKTPIPYLRGTTYDYYTGLRFVNQIQDHDLAPSIGDNSQPTETNSGLADRFDMNPNAMDAGTGRMDGSVVVKQEVKVLGGSITHLYGAPVFQTVVAVFDNLKVSTAGSVSVTTPMIQGAEYSVTSLVPSSDPDTLRRSGTDYPSSVVPRYLQVTNALKPRNQRLQSFADECTKGIRNPYDKVEALRDAIANRCRYNLQAPAVPRDRDVVEAFLFDLKEGYCDSFAAALTVLCRYANVPARLASGFIQGDRQSDGTYIVREKHKHAWTEVYFTNIGWVSFDATGGAVDLTPATTTNARSVMSPLRWLTSHGAGPPVIALLILILIAYVINTEVLSRNRQKIPVGISFEALPSSNMEIVQLYGQACSTLARLGLSRALHLTPTEFRLSIMDRLPPSSNAGVSLNELTNLHQNFAYGAAIASEADVVAARSALNRLTASISALPPAVSGTQHGAS